MAGIKMVVGLGNPGIEYADTRHNIGFRVVDSAASALKIDVKKKKFGAVFGQGEFADKNLILLKPCQFMNRSGEAVLKAVEFYKLSACDLLVIADDMALEPGTIRLRAKGSAGGHNGLTDIIEKLGTSEFGRLRIGIGQRGRLAGYDYVLNAPRKAEKLLLNEAVEKAQEAVLCWVEHGIETAMNKFNKVISL